MGVTTEELWIDPDDEGEHYYCYCPTKDDWCPSLQTDGGFLMRLSLHEDGVTWRVHAGGEDDLEIEASFRTREEGMAAYLHLQTLDYVNFEDVRQLNGLSDEELELIWGPYDEDEI